MGPRVDTRGKVGGQIEERLAALASMGPRVDTRGKAPAPDQGPGVLVASVRLRFDTRGKEDALTRSGLEYEWLQWGRALIRAERRKQAPAQSARGKLQWGRALIRAERPRCGWAE